VILPKVLRKAMSRPLTGLGAWLVFVCLVAGQLPLPRGAPLCFGQGLETAALALVQPFRDEGPVVTGVTLAQVGIESAEIRYHLRDVAGAQALVILRPPAEPGQPLRGAQLAAANSSLQAAQAALLAAIKRNDDGSLSARLAPAGALGLAQRLATRATLAGWLLVAVALLLRLWRMLAQISSLRRQLLALALLVGLTVCSGLVRISAPLTPLRPNAHAFTDFAIAMGHSAADVDYRAYRTYYGNTWIDAQRALVQVAGKTHDGVGFVAAVVGALAVALAAAAVAVASARLWPAVLAGLLLALAPVAVRVGHSESALVFAQFLVSAALFLGSSRGTLLERAAFVVAAALLAFPAVIGGALSTGVVLLTCAIAYQPIAPGTVPARRNWHGAAPWILLLVLILATAVWQASILAGGFTERPPTVQSILGTAAAWRPLWPSPAWGIPAALAMVALGIGGWLRITSGALPRLGLAAMLIACLFAVLAPMPTLATNLGSQLRYEATLGPILVFFFAAAPAFVPSQGRWRKPVRVLVAVSALAVALSLAVPQTGARFLDLQGRSYQELRRVLGGLRGDVTLVVPTPRPSAIPVTAPVGRWSRAGPMLVTHTADELLQRCRQGKLPGPQTFVLLDAVCTATRGAPPCEALVPLVDSTHVLARSVLRIPDGGLGEYHAYATDTFLWQVSVARCPDVR